MLRALVSSPQDGKRVTQDEADLILKEARDFQAKVVGSH
jgi:hypothetical protein